MGKITRFTGHCGPHSFTGESDVAAFGQILIAPVVVDGVPPCPGHRDIAFAVTGGWLLLLANPLSTRPCYPC